MNTPLTELLRRRMTALDITRQSLAGLLDVTDQAVGDWCRGNYGPHKDRYADVARALKCEVSEVALAAAGISAEPAAEAT